MKSTLLILLVLPRLALAQTDPKIDPDRVSFKPGSPLSSRALVTLPPVLKGVQSWSLEARMHRGRFHSMALSPDGKILATGGIDGTVRLWDPVTGQLLRALIGHESYVYGLSFSPGGRYLASGGSHDRTARIWEVSTGLLVKTLKGHPDWMAQVAWTLDGKWLIGGGGTSGYISMWEIGSGERRANASLGRALTGLSPHPDGLRVAAVTSESVVAILNIATGKTERTLGEAGQNYTALAWSPDGKKLAVGDPKTTRVHDVEAGSAVTLSVGGNALAWSKDGDQLATASAVGQTVRIWDVAKPVERRKILHYAAVIAFTPDAGRLVTGDSTNISVLDLAESKQVATHEIAGSNPPLWTPARPVVTGVGSAALTVWDPVTGEKRHHLEGHKGIVNAFAWSPDGKHVATAGSDKSVILWEAKTGQIVHQLGQHDGPVLCLAWSPDGKELASGSKDKTVRIHDAKSGSTLQTLPAHRNDVTCLAWSTSGNTLVVGVNDGTAFFYTRGTWKQSKYFGSPKLTSLSALSLSADAKSLAGADNNGVIVVWSVASNAVIADLPRSGSPPYISSLAFYPKGDTLAAGRGNHTLDFWSLPSGKKLQTVQTMSPTQAVVWTGGPLLAVSSSDRTCRFFDPFSTNLKGVLLAEPDQLIMASYDGHYRSNAAIDKELVYVAQTVRGQETLTPTEFASRFGWKNDTTRARVAK